MVEIKTLSFTTLRALDIWTRSNYPFVKVMSISAYGDPVAYDEGWVLTLPKVTVTYIEFPRPV